MRTQLQGGQSLSPGDSQQQSQLVRAPHLLGGDPGLPGELGPGRTGPELSPEDLSPHPSSPIPGRPSLRLGTFPASALATAQKRGTAPQPGTQPFHTSASWPGPHPHPGLQQPPIKAQSQPCRACTGLVRAGTPPCSRGEGRATVTSGNGLGYILYSDVFGGRAFHLEHGRLTPERRQRHVLMLLGMEG